MLLFQVGAYGKDNKIMPEALVEIAEQSQCEQVSDYYEGKPGVVKPPYLYSYISGPEENGAVFWCEKKSAGRRSYTLMFLLTRAGKVIYRPVLISKASSILEACMCIKIER